MKRRGMVSIGVAILTAVLAVAGTAAEASNGPARPFKGEYVADFAIVADGDWCDSESGAIPVLIEGHGQMTHLGRFDFEARHCTDPETGTFAEGVGTFVAANGDELWATYDGQFLAPLPDGTQVVASTHTYNGGTGRFTNASGTADAPAWFVFTSETDGPLRGTVDGTLAYEASDRSS